ncbi:uncharacterized protein LOC110247359 [Exaiptasia diaphana]|uniref:Transposase n=1 Tax=Exaiptasia diaphana TaxID=2652724 RepID=A0A913XTD1_EXADI|nr:uncharacterized protein LOC110247359 [Exaiptasia diaphana]
MGKIDGKDGFVCNRNTKVCHEHFKKDDILRVPGGKRWRLKQGAVPLKVGHEEAINKKRKPPAMRRDLFDIKKPKPTRSNKDVNNLEVNRPVHQPKSLVSCALTMVNCVYKTIVNEFTMTKTKLVKLEEELKDTKNKLEKRTFGIQVIKEKNDLCQQYTSFTDYSRLKACLKYLSVGDKGENVIGRGSTEKKGAGGRPRTLGVEDQFMVMLMKIRTGFSNDHLGWLFKCDATTISRIVSSWQNYIYLKFCTIPIWPSREKIDQNMPKIFKERFPKTRVILDCTEVEVEAPESLHMRAVFYSDYKHHNTYKALIGITPAGGLSFISELFPGSISDREIVSRCGILNPAFWCKGDEVMADKGFNIRDLLDEIDVKLNIPVFLEDKEQFSPNEVIINQRISSLRIHVERFISRIKNFHIFDRPLPLSMHGSANQIFTTCAFLVMFQNPIISV